MSEHAVGEKSEVEQELEKLVAPLQKLEAQLGRKEAELSMEMTRIRAERTRVNATLRSILPKPPEEKKERVVYGGQNVTISSEKVQQIREVVATFEDDWISNDVAARLPAMGKDTIRKGLIRLRESGEIRLSSMKRGRGGGMIFVTTPKGKAESNGAAP